MKWNRFGAGALAAVAAACLSAGAAQATIDNTHRIDVNSISCVVTNHDSYAYDIRTGLAGLEWPRGSGKTAVFAAGLWVGAKLDTGSTPIVKVGEYSQQWGPGPMVGGTGAPDSSAYHVYKIRRGDNASNPDYANWPVNQGAPTNADGTPLLLGDMTLWSVYNDRSADAAPNRAGTDGTDSTNSLGLEVQQTTFAFSRLGALNNVIFLKFKIINKGANHLRSTYVSLWADPDLGDASDDFVGCDTSLSIGYVYNSSNKDGVYGVAPPSVGWDFFQGPLDKHTGRRLPMTSFNKYTNGTDPQSPQDTYNFMQGLRSNGTPLVDNNGMTTTFQLAGDPVSGQGWIDSSPADRRLMLSAGPFDMDPGDTQEIVAGVIVGRGGDNKSSVTVMKLNDLDAQDAFDADFDLALPPPAPMVSVRNVPRGIDISWDGAAVGDHQHKVDKKSVVKDFYFEGYDVWQGSSTLGPWQKVATFDLDDSVGFIYGDQFNVTNNGLQREVLASGRNTGLRFHWSTTNDAITSSRIVDDKPYFFAVTSYSYEADHVTRYIDDRLHNLQGLITEVLENDPSSQAITIIPASSAKEYSSAVQHVAGNGDATILADVFKPDSADNHTYEVRFFNQYFQPDTSSSAIDSTLLWRLVDVTTGKTVADSQADFTGGLVETANMSPVVARVVVPTQQIRSAAYTPAGDDPYDGVSGVVSVGAEAPGLDVASDFLGTSLTPDQLFPIELRFSPGSGQKGYCYLRHGSPSYGYIGQGDLPFKAYDVSDPAHPRQINVAYVQNADSGADFSNFSPPRWDPPASGGSGGFQYLFPLRSAYSETPRPKYVADTLSNGDIDMLYAFWLRKKDDAVGPKAGDAISLNLQFNRLSPADVFRFKFTRMGDTTGASAKNDLSKIRVVPNPYMTRSIYETNAFNRVVKFTHMPTTKVTIRIFNLAGDLVRTLVRTDVTQAELSWDLLNEQRLPVASGVYVYQVDAGAIGKTVGKLAVFLEREKLTYF